MTQKKLIDLDRLFQSKNPSLYRFIPGFVMRYLKRVIHQDEANAFIEKHYQADAFTFSEEVVKVVGVTYDVFQLDRVPVTGGCILVCNHPLGALEAMCMVTELRKIRTDIRFIVNDLLLNLHNLQGVMVGVNKFGRLSSDSIQMLNDLFASEQLILLFPSGMVSRRKGGVVRDLAWKKTFVTRARKYQRPVIPVYIHARNSSFFYNLSNFRTFLGIKANIEMFYLVDEMYKQRGKHLSIVFGNHIDPATFTPERTDEQWAAQVREQVYQLETLIPKAPRL